MVQPRSKLWLAIIMLELLKKQWNDAELSGRITDVIVKLVCLKF